MVFIFLVLQTQINLTFTTDTVSLFRNQLGILLAVVNRFVVILNEIRQKLPALVPTKDLVENLVDHLALFKLPFDTSIIHGRPLGGSPRREVTVESW